MSDNKYINRKNKEDTRTSSTAQISPVPLAARRRLRGRVSQVGGFLGGIFGWIGRLMIASLFIVGGIMAAMNFRNFAQTVQQLGLPAPTILAGLAIFTKIVGGLLFTSLIPIPMGLTIGRLSLLILTGIATYFMNNPLKDANEMQNMLKNIAIMGGLLAA